MWQLKKNNYQVTVNPYVIGNAVGNSSAFVGREDLLQDVRNILQHSQENAIVLYGQRRIGKTSILRELEAKLKDEGYLPIFFDLQGRGTLSLEQLNQELANKISDKLNDQSQMGLEDILYNWQFSKKLVILFDEFEAVAGNEFEERQASKTFFPYWRDILSKVDKAKLNFVFTLGRKVEELNQQAMSLLKDIPSKKVSLFNKEATIKLIKLSDSADNKTLKWNDEAINAIWTQTGGHPLFTQILCYCIWHYLYDNNLFIKPRVKVADVNANLYKAIETGENQFHWLWDGLPATEKLVTSILASKNFITSQELEQLLKDNGLRIRKDDQQRATDILQEWDVIEVIAENKCSLRVELFRRWIAKYKQLSKVQEELDSSEYQAHSFYQAGKTLIATSQLEQAIKNLERAIKLNPNHIDGNTLLIETYLDQKNWEKAWKTAKALSLLRPKKARPLLSKSLEGLISGQNEDMQLRYYKETLEIDPEHTEVKEKLLNILKYKGDDSYQRGKLKQALRLKFDNFIKKYPAINSIFLMNYKNGIIILDSSPDFFLDIKYFSKLIRIKPNDIFRELGNPVYNILQFDNLSLITYFIKDKVLLGFITKTPAIEMYSIIDDELKNLKKDILDFLK